MITTYFQLYFSAIMNTFAHEYQEYKSLMNTRKKCHQVHEYSGPRPGITTELSIRAYKCKMLWYKFEKKS